MVDRLRLAVILSAVDRLSGPLKLTGYFFLRPRISSTFARCAGVKPCACLDAPGAFSTARAMPACRAASRFVRRCRRVRACGLNPLALIRIKGTSARQG